MLLYLFLVSLSQAALYEYRTSNVIPLGADNFQKQITKNRDDSVSVVHFYSDDPENHATKDIMEEVAKDYQGVLLITGLDCGTSFATCEKEGFQSGQVVVYPPNPVPPFAIEGTIDKQNILKNAARWVPKVNVVAVNENNFDTFIKDKPSVPKVLLFSDKKASPLIFNSLSNNLKSKLLFGFVNKDEESLVKKYKVKEFPKILVVKNSDKKPSEYSGEINYKDIFNFLNVFSETFVYGGGTAEESAATKPWVNEAVPELSRDSADDICYKANSLCVIYLNTGAISDEVYDRIKAVSKLFPADSVPKFTFMWIELGLEDTFVKTLLPDDDQLEGKTIVLNPGKRKRLLVHEESIEQLSDTLNKITSGDARFKIIKGNQLPSLAYRKQ